MSVHQATLTLHTSGQGTQEITGAVAREVKRSGLKAGVVTVFCQHTSCSLVIMENADPSARHDLEGWLNRLVPENDRHFVHTQEGPDDMPSHIKMALTRTSESVPLCRRPYAARHVAGHFLVGTPPCSAHAPRDCDGDRGVIRVRADVS